MDSPVPTHAATGRPFYGWAVVAGTFVVLFIGFGTAYSFAAFFQSLKDEFHAQRGQLSLVFAITGFIYFGFGAVSGPIADRIGPRRVVLAGIGLIAAGLLLASRAQTLWQIYLTYSVGVGFGVGLAYVPSIGSVQRWFVRRRGFASGLAVAGIGAGNLALPPLAAALIDLTDWRTTYVLLAGFTLAAGIAAALLIEHSPARRGLLPDGGPNPPDLTPQPPLKSAGAPISPRRALKGRGERPLADPPRDQAPLPFRGPPRGPSEARGVPADEQTGGEVGDTLRAALRSRPFWLMYGATVATSLGLFIPFAHLSPYTRDHGMSDATGAILVGLIGAGSAAGRLVLGGAADRLGRRRSLAAAFAGMAVMMVWWLGATSAWSLAVFAVIFGICYGGFVALMPALTADYYGARNAGGIIGVLYTGAGVGALVGPTLAGVAYDLRESYAIPIAFSAIANLVAVACVALLADPAGWRGGPGDTPRDTSPGELARPVDGPKMGGVPRDQRSPKGEYP